MMCPSFKKRNHSAVYMLIVNLIEKVLDFVQSGGLRGTELRTFNFEVSL